MTAVRLNIVSENFQCFSGTRIQQGEVCAGPEVQTTLLRSCICVGFYDAGSGLGAISHITGFREDGGHSPAGALKLLQKELDRFGKTFSDCECFVVGGSDRTRHVYDAVVEELGRREISYNVLDALGNFHRKLLLDPAAGVVTLLKRPVADPAFGAVTSSSSSQYFTDPRKRIATGASLLFRNERLLDVLREQVLESVLARGPRIHVWCAGCSIGMEVYSVAMVILDWLERNRTSADVRVLGTDISYEALDVAREGQYPVNQRTLKGYQPLLDRYAERVGGADVRMGPALRQVVLFKERDITVGSRGHRFELVICDHVLQYYGEQDQIAFLDSMTRAVQPGGFLYVSTPSIAVVDRIPKKYGFHPLARHFYRRG